MTVVRLIRDGLLPARQICVGAPYVIHEDDLDRLTGPPGCRHWSLQHHPIRGKKI